VGTARKSDGGWEVGGEEEKHGVHCVKWVCAVLMNPFPAGPIAIVKHSGVINRERCSSRLPGAGRGRGVSGVSCGRI